jgi:hypothetical protein
MKCFWMTSITGRAKMIDVFWNFFSAVPASTGYSESRLRTDPEPTEELSNGDLDRRQPRILSTTPRREVLFETLEAGATKIFWGTVVFNFFSSSLTMEQSKLEHFHPGRFFRVVRYLRVDITYSPGAILDIMALFENIRQAWKTWKGKTL